MKQFTLKALVAMAALAMLAQPSFSQDEAATAEKKEGKVLQAKPGDDLQEIVDEARPGDTIELAPGVYNESITIDFDGITLRGVIEKGKRPVFDGKGEMNDAILASGNDFTIENIEMRNYKANGVVVNQAKNATFRNLIGVNTGKYAVYPVQCDGVLIENCTVSDVWDAGIYAGQCENVEIRNNTTFRNTIGIEAENSDHVLIYGNTAFDNSMGILVVLLPNLPEKTATDALVINNHVIGNNYPNLAPEGEIVSMVQPGQGIVIAAADGSEVTQNEVRGHNSWGIVVSALTDSQEASQAEDARDIGGRLDKLDVEPNPDNNFIHDNRFAENGGGPLSPMYATMGMEKGGDVLWTGKGTGNAFNEPDAVTFPAQLPGPGTPTGAGGAN